jgi:hypothetical protein
MIIYACRHSKEINLDSANFFTTAVQRLASLAAICSQGRRRGRCQIRPEVQINQVVIITFNK